MKKTTTMAFAAITLLGAAGFSPCFGQLETINDDVLINGDDSTVNLKVVGTNGALFTGTFGSGSIPATGSGTRMMWYPKKAAFRVGRAASSEWDDSSIGDDSIGMGFQAEASGMRSVAMGGSAFASGSWAFATSTSSAEGNTSVAMAGGIATGFQSVGLYGGAYADGAIAFAGGETASFGSVAMGQACVVDYNEDPDEWVTTDSLLIIGNGVDWQNLSNALVMRKNANLRTAGKIESKGVIRAAPAAIFPWAPLTAAQARTPIRRRSTRASNTQASRKWRIDNGK